MKDCIFCKIIKGEIPSHKVYEDKYTVAFLDIAPANPGHVLVLPKKHFANIEEADEKTLCQIITTVKKIGKALKKSLKVTGYNVTENNGQVAGQIIPHLHFHIIPRKKDDGLKLWKQNKYSEGEAEEILKKIIKSLN